MDTSKPNSRRMHRVAPDGARADIFATILMRGPISRTELAGLTGLSQPTVTKAVAPLLASSYLIEDGQRASSGGRPQRLLEVNADRHVVVGIKIAPSSVTGVLTDMRAGVLRRETRSIGRMSPEELLQVAAETAISLLAGRVDDALGIGVAVGGHVDSSLGICRHSGLLDWHDVDVATPLAHATGLPVVVNNDVNALCVEERWFGAGRDNDLFAVVTIGAGVGCGLVVEGDLFHGASGMAGELGHIPVDPQGPMCTCGNVGCLEAIASEDAILARIGASSGITLTTIEDAIALARGPRAVGRKAARDAFRAAGDSVGRGIAVLLNVLNLEKVVLSGEGLVASDLFGDAMQQAVEAHAFSSAARDCELVIRQLGDDAWARGAACLVIREAVGTPPQLRADRQVPAGTP